MKFWTIRQWQAHILVAALAALSIQGMVFIDVLIMGAPAERFDTPTFHLTAAVSVALIVLIVRVIAHAAYRHAASRGMLRNACGPQEIMGLPHDCPHRVLITLHCLLCEPRLDDVHGAFAGRRDAPRYSDPKF
ncbi:conserved hypothetical protein [Paraburkholderia tropica]|uniref:hypothetical protein n=1 Tax=Paraburkholderia tropica TaxID=92647 RepID=UPI001CAB8CDF|nr:hypothetical protein [Paraburkholderia tropica]CAG9226377.1 conserved hypothetical protein [Paraburkholderia tropica]